ncbi:MAG TPA: AraC family transcriptional regulator [Bacilli bacterium]
MDPIEKEVLSCNYSYHSEPFYLNYRDGLPSYLFRLQTEGYCHALIEGRMTRIEAGDLLLYKPGDAYELRMEANTAGKVASGDYFLICDGEWVREWWERTLRPQQTSIDVNESLLSLWRQIIRENRRMEGRNTELAHYLLCSLCLCFDQALEETVTSSHPFAVSRMKRFIEENASDAFKVEDVAWHAQLSVSRTAHLFKESYGESIMQYALKVRLAMAVNQMKYSKHTLEHIAQSCGLGSYPYFHRVFKERYGITPRLYRRTM